MEIKNVRVYGLEESIIASGYPMTIGTPDEYEFLLREHELENILDQLAPINPLGYANQCVKDLKRATNLANTPLGSGHYTFLKGVVVQYDLTAPEYFWRQFDRYHFHDYISSQSKMHRILKFNIDEICNKYVTQNTIDELNYYIDLYNNYEQKKKYLPYLELRGGLKVPFTKQNLFQVVISNCPMGLELTARITDNYLQLKSKYTQRRHHKLEEWQDYCDWIETLPMAEELIVGRD